MSRIDEALKIKETINGMPVAEVEATGAAASRLDLYLREERPVPPEEPSVRFAEPSGRVVDPEFTHAEPPPPPAPPGPPAPSGRRRRRFDTERQARLVTGTTKAASLEQYRRLAAALHHEQEEHKLRTVMITSALPAEGKTLTVVNLALTLSESYQRRVLVIDGDLRFPSVHNMVGVANDRGLADTLRNPGLDLPIVPVPSSSLSVLPAGKPGAAPLAGLTSPRMKEVLDACAAHFDWVLIDTSPVGVLPDAQLLARLVGAVILVIGAGSTPAEAVERAVTELGGPDAIVGTVLNRVEERRIPASYYYDQYGG